MESILNFKNAYDLTGKVALVTGSTRGIGNSIAGTLASMGASVVISGRGQADCDRVAAEFCAAGYKAVGIAGSVSDPALSEELVAKTVAAFGRLDILVNNAGIGGTPKNMLDQDVETYDRMMNTDLKGVYFMSQAAARQMKAQGRPEGVDPYRIINLGSAAGIKAPRGDTIYGAAKAGVIHMSRIMANELGRYGILVNTVAPGYVVTDMTKGVMADEANANAVKKMITLRRYAEPGEIASVVGFLCSEAARYITGVLIPIDGGMTIN